jgi:hypothetical protein
MPGNAQPHWLDTYNALQLLRENVHYSDPTTLGMTDVADDIPGAGRILGPMVGSVLPSMAIISKDPEVRRQQIEAAKDKIRHSRNDPSHVKSEIWDNFKSLATKAVPVGLGLSSLFHGHKNAWRGFGPGSLLTKLRAGGLKGLRNPYSLRNFSNKPIKVYRADVGTPARKASRLGVLARHISGDAGLGVGLAALHGAAAPLRAQYTPVSDPALERAGQIMADRPYMTSLPASEALAAMDDGTKPNSRLKNTGIGLGIGALLGLGGAVLPSSPGLLKAVRSMAKNYENAQPALQGTGPIFRKLMKNFQLGATSGGALGALSGALHRPTPTSEVTDAHPPEINQT